MFISQVIFESDVENREAMERIMKKKKEDSKDAEGMLSSECWWKEDTKTVGFSIITKWKDREYFKTWMKETHKGGHKKAEMDIKKTVYQFQETE